MIQIGHVRMSFRNYRGNHESAQRIAKFAMESLDQKLGADSRLNSASRIVDRTTCDPIRVPVLGASETAIAEMAAEQIWQTIRRHV